MDQKGARVESYRITPEQRKFQKSFAKLSQLRDVLSKRSLGLAYAQATTKQMLQQVVVGMSKLKLPKEGVKELPGMNFSVDEDQQAAGNPENSDIFKL